MVSVIQDQIKLKNVYKFEDAFIMTGFGKYNILITLLCGMISMAFIFETACISFVLAASQCDLNMDIKEKGILGTMPLIGLLSTSQIWGYLADTMGRRRILLVSMSLGVVCSVLSSFSPNLITFMLMRLLTAAMVSSANSILFAFYGEMIPKTHVDIMISVMSTIFIASGIAGTGIAWGILTLDFRIPITFLGIVYRPWRLLVVTFTSTFIVSIIGMYFSPESPKFLMSQGKNEEVLEILKKIYVVNTGKSVSTYEVDEILIDEQDSITKTKENKSLINVILSQIVPIFKPPLLKYSLMVFVLCFGLIGIYNPLFIWLPDLIDRFYVALENNIDNETFCGLMEVRNNVRKTYAMNETNVLECDDSFKPNAYPTMLAFNALITIVNIIVAISLNWFSKKSILIFFLISSLTSTVLIHFITNYYIEWLLLVLYQACGATGGVVNAFVVELFPTQYRASAISIMLMFGRCGGIIGNNIFGILIENNCSLNFFISAGLLMSCLFVSFLLPGSFKKTSSQIPSQNR